MEKVTPTTLVIIDVQKAILTKPGMIPRPKETAEAMDATVQRIASLLARARASGTPVIFVQHDGPPNHRLETNTTGWEIRDEIAPLPGESVIRKRASDAFFETGLEAELQRRSIRRLIIAGAMTDYCVTTTVRRAVSQGYDMVLAADGHMTQDSATGLPFEQIIAYLNELLDEFDAGEHSVTVLPISKIQI
jgi:nicotinamidase-related amidase